MLRLAIVILNWNGCDMMRRFLPTVLRCSQGDGVEVIVADNASTDVSVNMLRSEFPDVRIIRLDRNYGFAEGYNRALKQVEAQYYMLLNSDVEIRQTDWLQPMLQYLDSHADTAACQPKLLKYPEGKEFEYAGAAGGFIDRWGYPYCRGRVLQTVETDTGQYDETPTTDHPLTPLHWATGAALMIRADAYWQAGGLDSRFFCHMEEIDLCWRLRIEGWKIVCVTDSTAYHLGGATLAQGNPRKTMLNFRNNRLMLYKNLPQHDLHRVLNVRMWLDVLAAIQFLLKGDVANMKAVREAYRQYKSMRPSYQDERLRIQSKRKESGVPDLVPRSILWQYYVKGRHTYIHSTL
ncbi:MAG: glycosyltransferase family 2 protein [Bacteroidaceae bacterium]|nr:glycosyltransferase family 2 protein [Bacteroidaceae bacterium]